MKKSGRTLGCALAVLVLLAGACSKSTTSSGPSSSAPAASAPLTIDGTTATNKGTQDLTGKTAFDLDLNNSGTQFYFQPTVLKGAPGQKVTLTLKNVGDTKHNFTLDAQNINQDVNTPGSSATVTVTFPQSGSVQFHCEYHQAIGMVGELVTS